MKNYKKYKTETINTVELPTPDAVADVIAAEILTNVNEHGRVISRRILRKSIINGLAKLALVTIAADDDTNDAERADDNAPVDPTVARKDIMDAVTNSIFDSFEILNLPKKPLAAMIATNAALAVQDTFDRYFIR